MAGLEFESTGAGDRDARRVLSVTQLNGRIKDVLQTEFPDVWVCGEISDLARPNSGHVYLTLKDERAQLRAVIWRRDALRLGFDLDDGLEVLCRGEVDVYAPRGSYQLIVQQMEPRGVGALQMAFQKLQARLAAEGLFDPAHKKPLPPFPHRLAVITSPTGAAIRDFLEVVRRRYPGVEITVIPVRVQGSGAAGEIARAVRLANTLVPAPDVLVVTRGGGSLEDLWCFNEEIVVRAIFAARIPVVSAVGHEIDVTLSDLVADVRALTPSEAAERVVPATQELEAGLRSFRQRLLAALTARASSARAQVESLAARRVLRRPAEMVHDRVRRLDELDGRMKRAARLDLGNSQAKTQALANQLESLSPLAVLGRGFSLTSRVSDGQFVRDVSELAVGETIRSQFQHGSTISRVETIQPDENADG